MIHSPQAMPSDPVPPRLPRIAGLDSIRAICALWVVLGHFGGPPLTHGLDESNPVARVFGGIYNNLWNGPAAVIIFFVISGFCIHYPHSRALRIPSVRAYFAQRYLRIGIPLVVAIGISTLLSVNLSLFGLSILWSLLAELIYYTLYPFLLAGRRRAASWVPLVLAGFVLALGVAATNPSAKDYPSFGNGLNWLLGLPCWLAGCWLADLRGRQPAPPPVSPWSIWIWRGLVFGLAMVCSMLRFHSPVGFPWSLNAFAMVSVFWLAREMEWFGRNPPWRWLEWAGAWSYSLYLFHVLAKPMYLRWEKPNFGYFFNWFFLMLFILATSYLFYLLVERPGHLAAKRAGRALAGKPTDAS